MDKDKLKGVLKNKKIVVPAVIALAAVALAIAGGVYLTGVFDNNPAGFNLPEAGMPPVPEKILPEDSGASRENSASEDAATTSDVMDEIVAASEIDPLENKPDINPASQTNPIKNIKTNPFD